MFRDHSEIRLVVFDWAGTTIDFGSQAPILAFRRVFEKHGIVPTDQQITEPMGLDKKKHLLAMLGMKEISESWKEIHGKTWTSLDVEDLYREFTDIQLETIATTSTLVPGLIETTDKIRKEGIRIGGTTGYFKAAAELVEKNASHQGFKVDANVCADDVVEGRPAPWMIYDVMRKLNVFPPSQVVKVGDTVADIKAALSAGCWAVGVCDTSSIVGLNRESFEALTETEKEAHRSKAAEVFQNAGSHAVINNLSELPDLIKRIEGRKIPTESLC